MDANQLISGVIENIVASLPQFFVLLGTILYSLTNIKKTTQDFPDQIKNTKDLLKTQFDTTKQEITQSFFDAKDLIVDSLKQSKEEMNTIVKDVTQQIYDNVNVAMDAMKNELNDYKEQLRSAKEQTNLAVREGKAFMEVIASLVAKDPKLVRDGVATIVATRLNMTKEELEKLPELIMTESNVLEQAMKEAIVLMGKEKFEELLGRIGYEAKQTEKLQTSE
jgi:uncharacterized membrane-anchored protein YhcB (DUF1043 family)